MHEPYRQKGDEMGVIAIKIFPVQSLIAVIFSDGSLRIRASCSEGDAALQFSQDIVDLNLLDGPIPDFLSSS
jgi:hypothetical protein